MKYLKYSFIFLLLFFSFDSFSQSCDSIGVEYGWTSWQWQMGDNSLGNPPSWSGSPAYNPSLGPTGHFMITSGNGIDPNTPGLNPGDSTIPLVCPKFGNHSIRLGDSCGVGYKCEKLIYSFNIGTYDTNFTVAYALVMQNPSHVPANMPFVSFCITDQSNNQIPSACFTKIAGPILPPGGGVNGTGCAPSGTEYKPWTIIDVNLSAYVGQTVTATIINADCAQGDHFAYSYWDFWCGIGSLGINEENKPSFEIFPSVSSSGIFSIKNISEVNNLSVYNAIGENIYSKIIIPNQTSTELNLSNQPKGIYFIKLQNNYGTATKKIVIAK